MTIEILYAQSYMQTNGQMTVDILLKNPETADIVIGMDMYTTDIPPKINGPRMVACVPKNTPCYSIRYTNIPFTDPYSIYVKRCISGPNCAGPGCTTFGTLVDDAFMGDMVDFGSPGVSGVPKDIFGSPHPVPSKIQVTCAPLPPPPITLNVAGVVAEMSTSDLFPGSQGWVRINVTLTGSGMLDIYVDNALLVADGPLNPGPTPFTYTYLKQLTPGTKHICVIGKSETGIVGNQVCTSIIVPSLVPPPPTGFTLQADKTSVTSGDYVVFSGTYSKGGQKIGIYSNKGYITTTVTNAAGSYKVGEVVNITETTKQTLTVYACAEGIISGVCPLLADKSNNITIDVTPKAIVPTEFTLAANRVSMLSGESVTFFGRYKPGEKVNIFYTTFPRTHITEAIVDSIGTYMVSTVLTSDTTKTVEVQACTAGPGGVLPECAAIADLSNTVSIIIAPLLPVGFTLQADKTSVTSGDYVVFSGTYKPGMKVGIYSNKGYITTTVTNAAGSYKVGGYVTITETTTQKLTVYACAEGIISGVCPLLADKSNNITIDVTPMKYKCSGAPDYTCIKDPSGKFADPDSCRAECKAPPPPVAEATHAFVINLSPLSWANLDGLKAYLPVVSSEFTKAITLYGWLGWSVIESRIEDSNKLVIYLRETAVAGMSPIASKVRALALPTLAAVIAALTTITAIAFRFGFMVLGFSIVNLLTKAVEVAKTQADTEKLRADVVAEMCKSGELTPAQCSEALKPPAEKGICETFGFSATACAQLKTGALVVGGLIVGYVAYKAVKTIAPKPTG